MLKYIISRHFILTRLPQTLQPQSIFANSSKSNVLWDCNLVSRHLLAITLHQSSKSKVGRGGGGAAGFTLKILVIHLILKDLNLRFVKDTNNFKNPNRCTQYMEDIFIFTTGLPHNPSFNRSKWIKSNLKFIFSLKGTLLDKNSTIEN